MRKEKYLIYLCNEEIKRVIVSLLFKNLRIKMLIW